MLTPQAAVAIVQAAERHNEKHLIASQQTGDGQTDVQMLINPSKSLVDRALERTSSWRSSADNTTAVTVMLDPLEPSRSEVLMSRKNERVPSPKSVSTPLLSANPPIENVPKLSSPPATILPSNDEMARAKNPDTSNVAIHREATPNDKVPSEETSSSQRSTTEHLQVTNENPEKELLPPSSSRESIRVAEISNKANESRIDETKSEETSSKPPNSDILSENSENWSKIDDETPPNSPKTPIEASPLKTSENLSGTTILSGKRHSAVLSKSRSVSASGKSRISRLRE